MKISKIANWICIALMGVLLLLQTVVPFWAPGVNPDTMTEMSVSIQEYLWFIPSDKVMAEFITPCFVVEKGEYLINHVVFMPVVVLVSSVAGIAVCLLKKSVFTSLLPLICGGVGAWGYITNPAFQLGGLWVLHLVVCILLFLVAGARIVFGIREKKAAAV